MKRVATVTALLLALAISATGQTRQDAVERTLAVTIDDLPWVGGPDDVGAARAATERLLAALRAHDAKATVFVTGGRLTIGGQPEAGKTLLRAWHDEGHRLENHGFDHLPFSSTPVDVYLEDVRRGAEPVRELLGARERFFRAPFNDIGADAVRNGGLLQWLAEQRVMLAPFTVEHSDYVFNDLLVDALERDDVAQAQRIGEAYLAQLDLALDFAESLAEETFGRPIPQVFLIHANALNAEHLGAMLDRLAARGYRFVDLEEAIRDPAYATAVGEPIRWGWSWLHRWRAGMGLPNRLRDEPDPPQWVMDASAALRAAPR